MYSAQTTAYTQYKRKSQSVWTNLKQAMEISAQRKALRILDERALDDLGISKDDAHAEASRRIWDF